MTPGSTSLADYITGLNGAVGVMMALRHRDATGQGQVIDVSLYEAIFRVLDELAPAYAEAGIVRGPEGTKTLNAVPHGHYQAKDGQMACDCLHVRRDVCAACQNDGARGVGRSRYVLARSGAGLLISMRSTG